MAMLNNQMVYIIFWQPPTGILWSFWKFWQVATREVWHHCHGACDWVCLELTQQMVLGILGSLHFKNSPSETKETMKKLTLYFLTFETDQKKSKWDISDSEGVTHSEAFAVGSSIFFLCKKIDRPRCQELVFKERMEVPAPANYNDWCYDFFFDNFHHVIASHFIIFIISEFTTGLELFYVWNLSL